MIYLIGAWSAVDIWLLIFILTGALVLWEIGAILTHRWHTISWLSQKHRWLAWLIGFILIGSGLGLFMWFVFVHTHHWIPY